MKNGVQSLIDGFMKRARSAQGDLADGVSGIRAKIVALKEEAGQDEISDEDRREELRSIDRQLLDAELTEESLIRAAEAAGFALSRRADADPRAVLAMEGDLP